MTGLPARIGDGGVQSICLARTGSSGLIAMSAGNQVCLKWTEQTAALDKAAMVVE
jgi:hypothetical protein